MTFLTCLALYVVIGLWFVLSLCAAAKAGDKG